jgi:LmbE family N-acetylglucosaminyl deacetylase
LLPIRQKNNLSLMNENDRGVRHRLCWLRPLTLALIFFSILFSSFAPAAETTLQPSSPTDPLPQDTGKAGLQEMLVRLGTTARLMQDVAHPDDEDGGMLTLESRGKGVTTLLLTLNRGEGGQNKVGSNLFDVLGVLRTLELLAADRYYGVEQRFTRVADFGFSKNADETFQKWQGHDIALGDMVRVIRTFRPDVLVARFSGTDRDGHGHHQASSILTREAFRAASDPTRFPEQIKEGLLPWQAKKLYAGNVCGFGAQTCPAENYTVRLNTNEPSPRLGMSYIQFSLEGLRHQLSQGAGTYSVDPGPRYTYYKLVDSVLPSTTDKDGHEQDFFDGIDTSLPGLASRLGSEEAKASFLRQSLLEIQSRIAEATATAEHDPAAAAKPLLSGLQGIRNLIDQIKTSKLSETSKDKLLIELRTKEDQLEQAANLAADVELRVTVGVPTAENAVDAFMAVPGQTFDVSTHVESKAKVDIKKIALDLPPGWTANEVHDGTATDATQTTFRVTVAGNAQFTRPYWHRADPERDAINAIDDPRYETLPFPPPTVRAHAIYTLDGKPGVINAVATVAYKDSNARTVTRVLAVAPAFSDMLEPGQQVIPTEGDAACRVRVGVSSNLSHDVKGTLHLKVPAGWRVQPSSLPVDFHRRDEKQSFEFKVFPASLKEGRAEIRAVLDSNGSNYSEGYSLVTREDLDSFYYYQPAVQRISIVDVKVPKDLRVAYIMGAGDDIPTVLTQIGMNITLIPADNFAAADLNQYQTIVLGIRAYDTQKELATDNRKLLDFVSGGGTLVVQYETAVGDFNKGNFTPYPAKLSRARVSVEESPVEILSPENGVFHYPNQITQHDFDGWVQERGLYFMEQWDDKFKPLLACRDPGEPQQKGGLLRAQYGKGTYIYTGYAFFRQLPAGVPGAIRLYVNLLSAGHEATSQ